MKYQKKLVGELIAFLTVALVIFGGLVILGLVGCDSPAARKTITPHARYLTQAAFAVARARSDNSKPASGKCKTCGGTGQWKLDGKPQGKCPACDGTGVAENNEDFRAKGGVAAAVPLRDVKPPLVLSSDSETSRKGGDESILPDKELSKEEIGAENTVAISSLEASVGCCSEAFEQIRQFISEEVTKQQKAKPVKTSPKKYPRDVESTAKLILTVVTGPNCKNCDRFERDRKRVGPLRSTIEDYFIVKHRIGVKDEARPAFIVSGDYDGRSIGYFGPVILNAWLRDQAKQRGRK